MIAQAGATFAILAVMPRVRPCQPSYRYISNKARYTLYFVGELATLDGSTLLDGDSSTWRRVLATSNGAVTADAIYGWMT